jgi:hypothetical protein
MTLCIGHHISPRAVIRTRMAVVVVMVMVIEVAMVTEVAVAVAMGTRSKPADLTEGMNLRFYVIFHKFLTEVAYEKLNKAYLERHCQFVNVNSAIKDKYIPESLKHLVIEERQLPNYNPFMQHSRFCESSVFFHVAKNPELLLDSLDFVGFLQYDMVLEDSLFQTLESATQTLEHPEKILFVQYAENCYRHLNQAIGLQGWKIVVDLYNRMFQTAHTLELVLDYKMPLYHSYMMSKGIFKKMMVFAEKSTPLIFEMLGCETHHLPYHLERSHGIFLILQTVEGHLDRWIQMPGIEHRDTLKDPWQSEATRSEATRSEATRSEATQ